MTSTWDWEHHGCFLLNFVILTNVAYLLLLLCSSCLVNLLLRPASMLGNCSVCSFGLLRCCRTGRWETSAGAAWMKIWPRAVCLPLLPPSLRPSVSEWVSEWAHNPPSQWSSVLHSSLNDKCFNRNPSADVIGSAVPRVQTARHSQKIHTDAADKQTIYCSRKKYTILLLD